MRPAKPREIDRAFGLAGAHQHAAVAGAQREDMTGRRQILGLGVIGNRVEDSLGAVGRGNSGGDASGRIDGNRKGGAKRRSVVRHHHGQAQMSHSFFRQGQADQTASMGRHEVDRFGRDLFGRHAEVAFVLAVLVIGEDDHAAAADLVNRFFDGR